MYPPNANIYYALNDRAINLLVKGNVDMRATTGESGEGDKNTFSDTEAVETVKKETGIELFIVDKNKTSRWTILPIS